MKARIRNALRRTLLAATVLLLLGCLLTGERPDVKLWLAVVLLLVTHLLSLRESLRAPQSDDGAGQSAGTASKTTAAAPSAGNPSAGTPAGTSDASAAAPASAGAARRDESARPAWRRSLTAPQITGLLLFVISVNEALACLRLMARGGETALPLALAVLLSAGGLWYLVSHGKQA
ncbi:hypothetical protein [uncultured Alistipes sp.]|uniref:hypothetical protein n=1 Tax=uncultured Alistipes sp. TaxID=538949 RepID=UPI001F9820E7|nr:hypothetical protein [uncultured Alistipes sp.]HIV32012.1 hypothetical protein [Candidatus Alistipes excrementigallinarum]